MKELECGIPQFSILDPIQFVVCINDLAERIRNNRALYLLYADDTTIFRQI